MFGSRASVILFLLTINKVDFTQSYGIRGMDDGKEIVVPTIITTTTPTIITTTPTIITTTPTIITTTPTNPTITTTASRILPTPTKPLPDSALPQVVEQISNENSSGNRKNSERTTGNIKDTSRESNKSGEKSIYNQKQSNFASGERAGCRRRYNRNRFSTTATSSSTTTGTGTATTPSIDPRGTTPSI